MLGFGRTVLPTNYVKVWAHGFAQQKGRTKGREYLVSWWCSSPAKVASGEVGQQRRSRGHRGCRGRTPRRSWSRGRWAPGGARPGAVSSPGCGAARRGERKEETDRDRDSVTLLCTERSGAGCWQQRGRAAASGWVAAAQCEGTRCEAIGPVRSWNSIFLSR